MNNIILMTDSYKVSHWKQYPPNTAYLYSYFESRGGDYANVLFFGLQYILKKYLIGQVVTQEKIDEAEKLYNTHLGSGIFNKKGWEYILQKHNGKLPVQIHARLEGTVLFDRREVLFTVENTDQECFWLTSYLETLLEQVWYPCTVATRSLAMKKQLNFFLERTGTDTPDFKLHDFGYRGSTSQESAAIGGAAHLVNFKGSDNVAAISLLQEYYAADMPAYSIPAAEHSTITAWGEEDEFFAYANILEEFPSGLVAVVSDSYDIFNACRNIWGGQLKERVQKRKGTVIIRPDSGKLPETLLEVLDILEEKFGTTKNKKGFKVLPKYLRVIQGDGINEKTLDEILLALHSARWSIDNVAFGSGGGLLQDMTRDTMRFAYKCSNIIRSDGRSEGISKNPITDRTKISKAGKFSSAGLKLVFKDGELLIDQTFNDIRDRVE